MTTSHYVESTPSAGPGSLVLSHPGGDQLSRDVRAIAADARLGVVREVHNPAGEDDS
ncbi:hypothetical protein [Actinosynnema sp. ALI-1.44]|uniref:hypothetical protein n=1 Tax=Actinosynnema sp. ALI-1.44 TaxID=1933779 RepID=UPI00143DD8D6|nr:hypothetical protein [Actinosynnema sp. ALI-1.44]